MWVWANSRTVKGREGWRALVHGVAESQTRLSDWTSTAAEVTISLNPHQMTSFWLKPFSSFLLLSEENSNSPSLNWCTRHSMNCPYTPLLPHPLPFSSCSLLQHLWPRFCSWNTVESSTLKTSSLSARPYTVSLSVLLNLKTRSIHLEVYVPKTQKMTKPN